MKSTLLAVIFLTTFSALTFAYPVTYVIEGHVDIWPSENIALADRTSTLMTATLSFDSDDFDIDSDADHCARCTYTYEINAAGETYTSYNVINGMTPFKGLIRRDSNTLWLLDEEPVSDGPEADIATIELVFAHEIIPGAAPDIADFVSGNWGIHSYTGAQNGAAGATLRGTIDRVSMIASVPEPSSIALLFGGIVGLVAALKLPKTRSSSLSTAGVSG